jgi:argininosuccinate lyase
VPFREAHGIVGGLVRAAVDRGKKLSELSEDELQELAPPLRGDPSGAAPRADGQFYELLDAVSMVESKVSDGGTAMSRVRDQLAQARQVLREAR